MFRNCLAAALRNLGRNRQHASISVLGLGIGLWGALLALLVARDQFTRDHFIPGYEGLYQVVTVTQVSGKPAEFSRASDSRLAVLLEERFPSMQGASRQAFENGGLQKDDVSETELIYWVDPDFFEVVQFPVVAGDLLSALRRPDGLVLDRSAARRYFGRDDPIGETLQLRSAATRELHPVVVTAVIEDPPLVGTSFQSGIFASGLAAFSPLARMDRDPSAVVGGNSDGVRTWVRLTPPDSPAAIQAGASRLMEGLGRSAEGSTVALELVRVDHINRHKGLAPEFAVKLAMIAILGVIILLVAVVNFVNLMTARSGQRSLEVGIRKVSGANRGSLILQFLGESYVYAVLGTVLAIVLTEWSLPHVNAFLNTDATFNYWRDGGLAALLLFLPFLLALVAGCWPALVLSSFRPQVALGAGHGASFGGNRLRQVLVTVQFTFLVGLMIAAGVVFQQRHFALNQALRLNTDQILMVWAPCREGFLNDLRAIAGVRGFACGGFQWLNNEPNRFPVRAHDGSQQSLWTVAVDLAVFDLYGVKPVAGRFTLDEAGREYPRDATRYVINETAARRLGFRTPQEAVGQRIGTPPVGQGASKGGQQIIAVVPDFSLSSIEKEIRPTAYLFEPSQQYLLSVKLAAHDIPATLAAIDRAWAATGASEPTNRFFLDERLEQMYLSMLRQAQGFAVFAVVTMLLAGIGLFGLVAASASQRIREIGVRKALGANTGDVVRLLLWQFSKPVLWANLVAWPAAGLLMQRWLAGFAYRVDFPIWLFPAAALAALLMALVTVTAQSLRVARSKPVAALRHQ